MVARQADADFEDEVLTGMDLSFEQQDDAT